MATLWARALLQRDSVGHVYTKIMQKLTLLFFFFSIQIIILLLYLSLFKINSKDLALPYSLETKNALFSAKDCL